MAKPIPVEYQILYGPAWYQKIVGNYEVDPDTGCWNWTGPEVSAEGYGRVGVMINGRSRRTFAHRAPVDSQAGSYTRTLDRRPPVLQHGVHQPGTYGTRYRTRKSATEPSPTSAGSST